MMCHFTHENAKHPLITIIYMHIIIYIDKGNLLNFNATIIRCIYYTKHSAVNYLAHS